MTADTVGGVWTYALELVHSLLPYGVHVHLATMGKKASPAQEQQAACIPNLSLHQSSFQLEWMDNPWKDVEAAGEWLLQLEEELEPDLIHLNNYCHGHLPWSAPVVVVAHSCVLSWWEAVKGEEAPQNYSIYKEMVKQGLQAADVVVAPTHSFLQTIKKLYGPLDYCEALPNSRDYCLFRPAQKEEFILSAGRLWDEAKNIISLQTAAQQLPWPVKIAGDATHPATGKAAEFQHLNLLGQLTQEETAQQLSKASIYALPAKYEPFGLSVLEAALSGCALVLGDIPSLRENWEGAALFADPDNPEDIAEKLSFLVRNPKIRLEMSHKARRKATAFSPVRQGAAYTKLYRKLWQKEGAAKDLNTLKTKTYSSTLKV